MDKTKYTYGKLMNTESPGSDIPVTAKNIDYKQGDDISQRIKHYIFPDGYIGWVSNNVIANIAMTTYNGLPEKQEMVNLDKGEKPKTIKITRFVFIPMNEPEESEAVKSVSDDILKAKARASRGQSIMDIAEEDEKKEFAEDEE